MSTFHEEPAMLGRIKFYKFGTKEFNFEDLEITDMRNLTVFVGKNGVGKTFIFKTLFFASTALNIYKVLLSTGSDQTDAIFENEVNRIFKLTFHRSDEMDGVVQISDANAEIYAFTLAMNKGKLDHFHLKILDEERFEKAGIQEVKYNSKEARTFEAYHRYLKTRKALNINILESNADIEKLGEFYKLYDIMWFEDIHRKIKDWEQEPQYLDSMVNNLRGIFGETAEEISGYKEGDSIIAKDGLLYVRRGETLIPFDELSAGEQSMHMLYMFTK